MTIALHNSLSAFHEVLPIDDTPPVQVFVLQSSSVARLLTRQGCQRTNIGITSAIKDGRRVVEEYVYERRKRPRRLADGRESGLSTFQTTKEPFTVHLLSLGPLEKNP